MHKFLIGGFPSPAVTAQKSPGSHGMSKDSPPPQRASRQSQGESGNKLFRRIPHPDCLISYSAYKTMPTAVKIFSLKYFYQQGKKKRHALLRVSVLALPIFPGRRQPSIVGRNELNYRVRNGNGWTLALISTNYLLSGLPENILYYIVFSALCQEEFGDPYRIRTDVNGVRGRCLNHLTNGPWCTFTDSNRGPTD